MKWQNITANDLQSIVNKLSLEPTKQKRRSPHPVFWYNLDGKKTLRVTMPNMHGGSKSLSTGFIKKIRENLKINNQELVDLAECPLSAEEYESLIRDRLENNQY